MPRRCDRARKRRAHGPALLDLTPSKEFSRHERTPNLRHDHEIAVHEARVRIEAAQRVLDHALFLGSDITPREAAEQAHVLAGKALAWLRAA